MGGAILARFAIKYPERCLKFVNVVGAGFYPPEGRSPEEEAEALDQVVKTRAALANPTAEGLRPRLEWLFHDKSMVTDELCETRARIWGSPEYQAYHNSPRDRAEPVRHPSNSNYDMLESLGKSVDTLFLWTEDNPGTHPDTAKKAQELTPNSEFMLMSDCGHWPQYEKPEEFDRILIDFLTA
jgi:2-hydroxy-6-oxo-6-(2'-carboxyphenyl)-hexa-2,4-dienoate hydrolase